MPWCSLALTEMSNKPDFFIYLCVPGGQWQWVLEIFQFMTHKQSFFLGCHKIHPANVLISSQTNIQKAPMKISGVHFLSSSFLSIILQCKFQLFQPTWIPISTLQLIETIVVYLNSSFLCHSTNLPAGKELEWL